MSGSNNDLTKNEFNSGSSFSIHSKAASISQQDLKRPIYASDISNRLPNIVCFGSIFCIIKIIHIGPKGIYNRRVGN